MVNQLDLND